MRKDISTITKKEITELILNHKSAPQMASCLDISYSSVRVLITQYGLDDLFQKNKPKKVNNQEYDKNIIINNAKKLIKKHGIISKSKLAELLGIGYPTLRKAIKDTDIQLKQIRNHKISNVDFLEFMKTNPKTKKQIIDHFNIRGEYVTRLLKQNNIPDAFPIRYYDERYTLFDKYIRNNHFIIDFDEVDSTIGLNYNEAYNYLTAKHIKYKAKTQLEFDNDIKTYKQYIEKHNGLITYQQMAKDLNQEVILIKSRLKNPNYNFKYKIDKSKYQPTRQRNAKIDRINDDQLKDYLIQGLPKYKIAEKLKIDRKLLADAIVKKNLEKYYVNPNKLRMIDKVSKQELIDIIKNEKISKQSELAKKFNVSPHIVKSTMTYYGIVLYGTDDVFPHMGKYLNLSDNPNKNHISIKDLDYEKVVLLIKGSNPVVYVEKDGKGKTTTPKALIEEYIRKEKLK